MKLEVQRAEPTPPPVEAFILTLTPLEAEALRVICQHVGGLPTGPRGLFSTIDEQLKGAGVPRRRVFRYSPGNRGAIYMADEWPKE